MRRNLAVVVAALIILGLTSAAQAQDGILSSIEDFLNGATETLDNNRLLGKIRLSPRISQHAIYDDNIFLNDAHEADTTGREWDLISDSRVRLGLVLPVNEEYSKFFERDRLTLLSYEARFLEYMRRGDTDSINQDVQTDLFGFLQDLLNLGVQGRNIYFDAGARWTNVSDPIDILFRDLNQPGFPVRGEIEKIRRDRFEGRAGLGYRGNRFDAFAGYEFDWMDFSDDFFVQADHESHSFVAEIGANPPLIPDKRVYGRFTYTKLDFRKEFLNDANIREYLVGLEGALFSKKLKFDAAGGFLEWDTQSTGIVGDEHEHAGGVGLVRVVYKPFETRETRFQVEGKRDLQWSAISNFRIDQRVAVTVFDEIMPKKLDADLTVAWSHHHPSEGPVRILLEAGVGLTYHLFRQVDVSARYLFRNQVEERETALTTASPGGAVTKIETEGDFHQNVFSLGLAITF